MSQSELIVVRELLALWFTTGVMVILLDYLITGIKSDD